VDSRGESKNHKKKVDSDLRRSGMVQPSPVLRELSPESDEGGGGGLLLKREGKRKEKEKKSINRCSWRCLFDL